jgi:dihydropteroate synthase
MLTLNCRGNIIDIRKPLIMGILNITNDSFYSGSRTPELKETIAKAGKMLESGASILDIGGVSTIWRF